jgi:excisionase family DNA binding protein
MKSLPNKDLLRVDEVAEYLGVSERTVRRWCGEGRLFFFQACPKCGIRIKRLSVLGMEKDAARSVATP